MKVTFKINYRTCYGQQLLIEGIPGQGQALMTPKNNGDWFLTVDLDTLAAKEFEYKYLMRDNNTKQVLYEFDKRKFYPPVMESGEILVRDFWKPLVSPSNVMYSSAFKDVVFKRENKTPFVPLKDVVARVFA